MEIAIGTEIVVHSQQLRGCYVESDGSRSTHFAVPGTYRLAAIDGGSAVLTSSKGSRFECAMAEVRMIHAFNCGVGHE